MVSPAREESPCGSGNPDLVVLDAVRAGQRREARDRHAFEELRFDQALTGRDNALAALLIDLPEVERALGTV